MKLNSFEFQSIQNELNINFQKFCTLELIPNKDGSIYYIPQPRYNNVKRLPLLNGIEKDTPFCKFKPDIPKIRGLYLWVIDDEIVYIGEGVNLNYRFNNGYGSISPRNCYQGGQSTNVKMNRLALKIYESNRKIDIYIFETQENKALERKLLSKISTEYNIKNN